MKFYISAMVALAEEVREMYSILEERGHEIAFKWTEFENPKPYGENQDISARLSDQCIKGAVSSDVFILCSDDAGTGMYVEFGAAILAHLNDKKPLIYVIEKPLLYVIGNYHSRSMFNFHPSVHRRIDLGDVLLDIDTYKVGVKPHYFGTKELTAYVGLDKLDKLKPLVLNPNDVAQALLKLYKINEERGMKIFDLVEFTHPTQRLDNDDYESPGILAHLNYLETLGAAVSYDLGEYIINEEGKRRFEETIKSFLKQNPNAALALANVLDVNFKENLSRLETLLI